jgi:hypothetical protein
MTGDLLTIAQAAELMGLSRRQTRRRLTALHAKHPALRLLQRPAYDGEGVNYRVSPSALRRVLLDDDAITLQDVSSRVGILEADGRVSRLRIDRLENEHNRRKSCQFSDRPTVESGTHGT